MIKLENIRKEYGIGETLNTVLNGVNLEIADGEMAAIVGASGSGKTSLLNILGLLDSSFDGNYYVDNVDVKKLNSSQRAKLRNEAFGFVLQDFALIENYTVKENIMLPLRYSKKSNENVSQRMENLLKRLRISEKINTPVNNLSGGQRQRTAIARAMINEPKIILADEPTGALDSETGNGIFDIFRELNDGGITVVMVTHDNSLAQKCGRVIAIKDGKII